MYDEATSLPPSWQRVVDKYVQGYGNARCERWNEQLVHVEDGLPKAIEFAGPVLRGFARKAAQALRNTCTDCGGQAKPRFHGAGWAVQCSGCFGKTSLAQQIDELIAQAFDEEVNPFDGKRVVWPEHELPALLGACIPSECWRHMTLPGGQRIRFVGREDVQGLTPWLKRVQQVMRG